MKKSWLVLVLLMFLVETLTPAVMYCLMLYWTLLWFPGVTGFILLVIELVVIYYVCGKPLMKFYRIFREEFRKAGGKTEQSPPDKGRS